MPIKDPGAYVHPKKKKKADPPADHPKSIAASSAAKKKETSTSAKPNIALEKTEQFRLVLYPPVEGQVPVYDAMIKAGFSPNRALLGLLKKGFDAFETDLLVGNVFATSKELKTDGSPVDTTRNVSPQFMEKAREVFDPFGVLSGRALGRAVAEHILHMSSKL